MDGSKVKGTGTLVLGLSTINPDKRVKRAEFVYCY